MRLRTLSMALVSAPESSKAPFPNYRVLPALGSVQAHMGAARHWFQVLRVVVVLVFVVVMHDVRLICEQAGRTGDNALFAIVDASAKVDGDVLAGFGSAAEPRVRVGAADVLRPHVMALQEARDGSAGVVGAYPSAAAALARRSGERRGVGVRTAVVAVDVLGGIARVVTVSALFWDRCRLSASAHADAGEVGDLVGRGNLSWGCHDPSIAQRYREG